MKPAANRKVDPARAQEIVDALDDAVTCVSDALMKLTGPTRNSQTLYSLHDKLAGLRHDLVVITRTAKNVLGTNTSD